MSKRYILRPVAEHSNATLRYCQAYQKLRGGSREGLEPFTFQPDGLPRGIGTLHAHTSLGTERGAKPARRFGGRTVTLPPQTLPHRTAFVVRAELQERHLLLTWSSPLFWARRRRTARSSCGRPPGETVVGSTFRALHAPPQPPHPGKSHKSNLPLHPPSLQAPTWGHPAPLAPLQGLSPAAP